MFDIGASELLMIVVVAIVVIGPKDLPLALRSAGRWVAKIRSVSGHFRSGIETMIREAELEEMRQRNKVNIHNAPLSGEQKSQLIREATNTDKKLLKALNDPKTPKTGGPQSSRATICLKTDTKN